MAFPTSFNGWIAYLRNWIGADEYSDAQIATFLDLGTVRLNADLATYWMEKVFARTILPGSMGVPIDLVMTIPDFNRVRLVSVRGIGPLDVAALNEYVEKAQDLTNQEVTPQLYNIDHGQLFLWPWPADDSIVDIHYTEMVPPLSDTISSNTFTRHHQDAFLYAACMEAAPYMVEDERTPVWEAKYAAAVIQANGNVTKIKMGSTPLKRVIRGLS